MSQNSLDRLVSLVFTMRHLALEHGKFQPEINPTTLLRLEVLRYVNEYDHPTMRNLAVNFGITPPSATPLVEALVASGNLRRITDKHDRRIVRLEATPKGVTTIKTGLRGIKSRMKQVLGSLNKTDRENLIKILKKLSKTYNH